MNIILWAFFTILLIATLPPHGLASASVVPAFLWSPHQDEIKEDVNYQTLSPHDLAKSVLSDAGWSNILCQRKMLQKHSGLAIVFVGRMLKSDDISGKKRSDPALVNLIKAAYTSSNFSMAFPYIAASDDNEAMERSLVSGFMDVCGQELGFGNVAFLESCSLEGENFEKLADLSSVHGYLVSRVQKQPMGQTDLLVVCNGASYSSEEPGDSHFNSDDIILSELVSWVEHLGTKYSLLYVSDPLRLYQHSSYQKLQRALAEGSFGNGTANFTSCDELCQIKSSLLEGLLVGIILLIILISGLCCMAGIDTPTRFESPQDS